MMNCGIVRALHQNEAGRHVRKHDADPKPSTFSRKDEDYD